MKTTVELPDDLMTAVKIKAAQENRKLKDIIAELLRQSLGLNKPKVRHSVRDIHPVQAGGIKDQGNSDLMEDMLDVRGHRY